jgi:hypothetical protein
MYARISLWTPGALLMEVFVHLYRQCLRQPKATRRVRKDADDQRPPFQLLIESLQHIRRFQVLVVRQRQSIER